jgi:hypothetical protein
MPDINDHEPLDDIAAEEEVLPSEQPTEDAASPRKVAQRRRSLAREREQEETYLRAVLADPVGRRVLYGILNAAHTFDTRFAVGPSGFPDANATWFHAGEQALGLGLYQRWQQIDHQAVFLMLTENDSRFQPPPKTRRK